MNAWTWAALLLPYLTLAGLLLFVAVYPRFGGHLPEVIGRRETTLDQARLDLHRMASALNRAGLEPQADLVMRVAVALANEEDLASALDFWRGAQEELPEWPTEEPDHPAPLSRQPGEEPVFGTASGGVVGFVRDLRREGTEQCITFDTGVQLRRSRNLWCTAASRDDLAKLPSHVFRLAASAFLVLLPVAARAAAPPHCLDYPAEQLSQVHHPSIPAGALICATGWVESVRLQKDRDVHVWACSTPAKRRMPERRRECVLGEVVPRHSLPRPARGVQVRMCGRWVEQDLSHGWTELHPVESLEVIP